MKKLTLLLFFNLCFTSLIAQNDSISQNVKIDSILNTIFSSNQPGGTVLVANKGKVIYHKAFGKANLELDVDMKTNQVFKIASNTKPFTAVAILKLAEEGKLSLNDNISKYIKDSSYENQEISIEHLLTHTSGIYNYTNLNNFDSIVRRDYSKKELVGLFKDKPLDFDPGTDFSYSNSAYELLGLIISTVTNKTYESYINDSFFEPLGMKNTYYAGPQIIIKNNTQAYLEHNGYYIKADYMSEAFETSSAGGLKSTVSDLYLWYKALMNYEIISKASIDKSITPYKLKSGKLTQTGYSWFLGNLLGSNFIWHEGSTMGYYSSVQYFPNEQIFVAALTNCNWEEKALDFANAGQKIASILLNKEYFNKPQILKEKLHEYEAIYTSNMGVSKAVTFENEQLILTDENQRKMNLLYYQNDLFYIEGTKATMHFQRNSKQEITGINWMMNESMFLERTTKELPKKSVAQTIINEAMVNGIEKSVELYYKIKDSDKYYLNEDEMNQVGYAFLQRESIEDAIKIFELNAKAFPNSSNVYDSLGEAYFRVGDKKLSIQNYKKSLEINPKNEHAIKMLKELKNG